MFHPLKLYNLFSNKTVILKLRRDEGVNIQKKLQYELFLFRFCMAGRKKNDIAELKLLMNGCNTEHKLRPLLLFAALCSFLTPFWISESLAEYECSAEVFYVWLPRPQELKEEAKTPPPPAAPQRVSFEALRARGENEQLSKTALQKKAERPIESARLRCQRMHEDVSGCIAGKHALNNSTMKQLSFSARRELEESIAEDCNALAGTCQNVELGEITCLNLDQEAEGTEEGKGNEKKKR